MWGNDVGAHAIRPARSPSWPGLLRARCMRCESAQIDPVESFRSAFQQRFRRFRFRFVLFAERIVRAHMLAACDHRLRGFHARHVNGDHVFVAFAAIRSKEYGERRRMRVQFRRHVGAGQLRETHMHVGVVRDGAPCPRGTATMPSLTRMTFVSGSSSAVSNRSGSSRLETS